LQEYRRAETLQERCQSIYHGWRDENRAARICLRQQIRVCCFFYRECKFYMLIRTGIECCISFRLQLFGYLRNTSQPLTALCLPTYSKVFGSLSQRGLNTASSIGLGMKYLFLCLMFFIVCLLFTCTAS